MINRMLTVGAFILWGCGWMATTLSLWHCRQLEDGTYQEQLWPLHLIFFSIPYICFGVAIALVLKNRKGLVPIVLLGTLMTIMSAVDYWYPLSSKQTAALRLIQLWLYQLIISSLMVAVGVRGKNGV